MSAPVISVWGVEGIPEIAAGDDLVDVVYRAIEAQAQVDAALRVLDGDILVVTSKIVSKAEGRQIPAAQRESAIEADTVRVVAERAHNDGVTRIVETRQGLVMAGAGIDMSNVPEGIALRLPEDPDRSARALCAGLRERLGVTIGVIVTDTVGRAWRLGQTDLAIGASGVKLSDDLRGDVDANGRPLHATIAVVADEIAGAADLVKGKASGIPVAVVRGLARLVLPIDAPGAATLVRPASDDLFRLGAEEAYRMGYEAAKAELDKRSARPDKVLERQG